MIHVSVEQQTIIFRVCLFFQYEINIFELLPVNNGQKNFNLVAINCFTKQVEVKLLATITTTKMRCIVWKNIMCKFGISKVISKDNGRQFDNHSFRVFCTNYHIDHRQISTAHLYSNGQIVVTNRTILWDLKTMLEKEKGLWVENYPMCYGHTTQHQGNRLAKYFSNYLS